MAKPSDFYLSVLDFFGALLPGAITVGGAMALGVDVDWPFAGEASRFVAFAMASWVVGQMTNAIGSEGLDRIYDWRFAPSDDDAGMKSFRDSLTKVCGSIESKKAYQTARAYFLVEQPRVFSDLEKREAEQKFFRALCAGFVVLAIVALCVQQWVDAPVLVLLSVGAFARYVRIRNKTVETARRYFELRAHALATREARASRVEVKNAANA